MVAQTCAAHGLNGILQKLRRGLALSMLTAPVFALLVPWLDMLLACPPHARSLYKGITPLWGRQIPYTMMKFGELGCIHEWKPRHWCARA